MIPTRSYWVLGILFVHLLRASISSDLFLIIPCPTKTTADNVGPGQQYILKYLSTCVQLVRREEGRGRPERKQRQPRVHLGLTDDLGTLGS